MKISLLGFKQMCLLNSVLFDAPSFCLEKLLIRLYTDNKKVLLYILSFGFLSYKLKLPEKGER